MSNYDVFLSHASVDKPVVEALALKLRDTEGLEVFFDQWELVPGTPWQEALEKALAASRTCAVFLGPEGLGPWHNAEMRVALGQRVEQEPKRVIPVLLPDADESAIPDFLAMRTWVDLRSGLDDEAAFARLVAGIRGEAPGAKVLAYPESKEEDAPTIALQRRESWRGARSRGQGLRVPKAVSSRHFGIAIGILGALLTTAAWLWPRTPDPSPSVDPAIYALRVQVVDPGGRPIGGSTVRASVGSEPQLLPDGWWEIEIPAAKVPSDGKVTIWAEHQQWLGRRADLELGEDRNPRAEVQLKLPKSRIRGVVVDIDGNSVEGARVTVRDHAGSEAETDSSGRFELTVEAAPQSSVRLHVAHDDFLARDAFCYAGLDGCSILLGV